MALFSSLFGKVVSTIMRSGEICSQRAERPGPVSPVKNIFFPSLDVISKPTVEIV